MTGAKTTHWAESQFEAADKAGQDLLASEPRAISARYEAPAGRVEVGLSNGCAFSFPARVVQGLETASDEDLARVKPLGVGLALEWEELDVQATLAGLMAGVFGTKRYMAELARRAGRSRSPAKAAAARINGTKGGRPRKSVSA